MAFCPSLEKRKLCPVNRYACYGFPSNELPGWKPSPPAQPPFPKASTEFLARRAYRPSFWTIDAWFINFALWRFFSALKRRTNVSESVSQETWAYFKVWKSYFQRGSFPLVFLFAWRHYSSRWYQRYRIVEDRSHPLTTTSQILMYDFSFATLLNFEFKIEDDEIAFVWYSKFDKLAGKRSNFREVTEVIEVFEFIADSAVEKILQYFHFITIILLMANDVMRNHFRIKWKLEALKRAQFWYCKISFYELQVRSKSKSVSEFKFLSNFFKTRKFAHEKSLI